jgi:hypothetical protein
LYNLTIGVPKDYFRIRLTSEVKADMRIWRDFLLKHNRKSFFLDYIWLNNDTLRLYTDASTTIGYSAVLGTRWEARTWSPECQGINIAILELYPIYLALELWGELLTNKCIILRSDNIAVVHIINKNTSKDKTIMLILRKLVLTCMKYNIYAKALHIPGKLNDVADALSRSQVPRARRLASHLDIQPQQVPPHLELQQLSKE